MKQRGTPTQADLFSTPEISKHQQHQARQSADWMCGDRWIETGSPWLDQEAAATDREDETLPS